MSTDLAEWIVDRGSNRGPLRYLRDVMCRGDEDVLLWTDEPANAWRLEREEADAYAIVSYWPAVVIHESSLAGGDGDG